MAKVSIDLTQDGVDDFVRKNRPLFRWTPAGNITHDDVQYPDVIGDWTLRIVNTRGCNNQGELIALPTNQRSRSIWNDAKLAMIKLDLPDVDEETIKFYMTMCRRVPYAYEHKVYTFVLENLKRMTEEEYYAIRNSDNSFVTASQFGYRANMSWPRFKSALDIIGKMWRLEVA